MGTGPLLSTRTDAEAEKHVISTSVVGFDTQEPVEGDEQPQQAPEQLSEELQSLLEQQTPASTT
jgi:hypothetical protein